MTTNSGIRIFKASKVLTCFAAVHRDLSLLCVVLVSARYLVLERLTGYWTLKRLSI